MKDKRLKQMVRRVHSQRYHIEDDDQAVAALTAWQESPEGLRSRHQEILIEHGKPAADRFAAEHKEIFHEQ